MEWAQTAIKTRAAGSPRPACAGRTPTTVACRCSANVFFGAVAGLAGAVVFRPLLAPARVRRKPRRVAPMHRCIIGPGPAAELRALVVGHGLRNLGLRVHRERAVLRHRLADG